MAGVLVGGREYAVGGWGDYELGRREAAAEEPRERYPGAEEVSLDDAVGSILASRRRPTPLERAASRLGGALEELERRACRGECAVVPPLSASELRALPADPPTPELRALAAAAAATAEAFGGLRAGLAQAPAESEAGAGGRSVAPVKASDGAGIRRLEAEAAPRAEAREALEGAVAESFEAAAEAVGAGISGRFGAPR